MKSVFLKNKKKDLLYPVLLECSELTEDDYWKGIFNEMAHGKCPKGIYISDGVVFCCTLANRKKKFSYPINDKPPDQIVTELSKLLIDTTRVSSQRDQKTKKRLAFEFYSKIKNTKYLKWSSIKKSSTRKIEVVSYVLRLKDEFDLSWEETKGVLNLIQVGLLNKVIASADVNFTTSPSGEAGIKSINGIVYDRLSGTFVNTNLTTENKSLFGDTFTASSKGEEVKTISLESQWEDFVKTRLKHEPQGV